jgi:protein-S-isoprenylcysteine O-methyltransferase Ste14
MKRFWDAHRQTLVNLGAFVSIGAWIGWYTWDKWNRHELLNFVQLAFLVHNVIWLVIFLVRRPHRGADTNLFHQAVALAAFYSGLAFRGEPTSDPTLLLAAQVVTGAAVVLGTLTLLNLGRSFGILIAARKIKTDWLYSVVRHPMYLTDIVWKVGMVLFLPYLANAVVMVFAVACYVYRAILEEKFLCQFPEYRDYMKKVRYRFVPGVF